jgi:hypothetical protein
LITWAMSDREEVRIKAVRLIARLSVEVGKVTRAARNFTRTLVSRVHKWIYFDGSGNAKPAARNAACPEADIKYFTKARAASGDLLALRTTAE